MSEEKKNQKNSADDNALNGMTSEFGNIFNEIKEESDLNTETDSEQESSIRGIFGRIKKKKRQESENIAIDSEKKTSSMKISESQEIVDLSQKVTENSVQSSVVVVSAEEDSKGITTITMKIPKLTDEKLAELKTEESKKQTEAKQDDKSEDLEQPKDELENQKNEAENSDEVENIGDILKNPETKEPEKKDSELPKTKENNDIDITQENSGEKSTGFKAKLSKFLSTAKEKAIYYLGFDEDDDYDDDVIYSTSSEIERSKNANPLDFDEEYKENIVYQAPAEEKKDDKPDLLKVAAQNTTINQDFDLSEEKIENPKQVEEPKSKSNKAKQIEETKSESDKIERIEEIKSESDEIEQIEEIKSESDEIEQIEETKSESNKVKQAEEIKSKSDKVRQEKETTPKSKSEVNPEDLTFDEILAAEKRKQISIDISLDDENTSEAEVVSDSPLYDQLDFSVLAEQIAGDVLRETRRPKRSSKSIVKSEVAEQTVESEIKSEVAEQAVESEVKSEIAEQAIESEVKSEIAEQAVESETKPAVAEQVVESEVKSEIAEQAVESEVKSEIAEQAVESETKPAVAEQAVESEIKPEVAEQAVESEVKSEVAEQAVESEVKSEIAEQAVESEVKSEIAEQVVESEIKSEVAEQVVESEIKSEVAEQVTESETKSEVIEQSFEESKANDLDDDLLNPFIQIVDLPKRKTVKTKAKVEQPVEIEAKAEDEQPVEVEAKAEVEQPVEIEAKAEDEQPVEVEAKAEVEQTAEVEAKAEVEQPAEVEAKAEDEQPVEIEAKAEVEQPAEIETKEEIEQPVEIEAKAEVEQPVEIEAKAEVEQPAEIEAKSEVEQPVEIEAKADEKQPIQDEIDDINPFIKIVDKTRKKASVAENKTEKFNPVIIPKEKPTSEFRLDFEKGYNETPKNLLIYKRPSERSNFIVMAGKFTKTVRSEYRAYRYKPTSPEPPETPPTQNPQTNTKISQSKPVNENEENPFVGDSFLKKRKKKNKPQNEEQPKNQEKAQNPTKIPVQKQTKIKPEATVKQEKQQIKTEDTEPQVPKAKIHKPSLPKPKIPPISPTVKAVVPNFMQKKQRPEIMPDIKEENLDENPVQPKQTQKPEPKKENKIGKASKTRKAIKKKTQMLKLFSSDEDIEIDDIDGNIEKKEIEEYENKSEEREIRFEINNNYRKLTIRSIIVSICLALSILIDVFVGFMSETFLNMPFGWLLIAFLNALVLCVAVVFCYVPIINGIMPLRHFKGNSDTSIAVASFAGILQAFVLFFTPNMFVNGSLHSYTTLIIMALLINCIGRMMIIKRVHDNFKFIMKNPELYAGKIYTDERNAKKMYSGAPLNKPLIAYRKRTNFLSNFLQLSYAPDPSENMAAKIAPITSVIAIVGAVVYGIISGGVSEGVCAFALFAIMLTPICELIAVNLPIKNLCSAVVKKGSMVTSYESVKQFCDTNAIIVDSNDLYPSGTVTMSGIKTFSGSKVDDAIRGAAAVMLAVKAPMSSMFDNIIKSKRDTLPHVESVIYEDGLGLVGWVAGQRILLGNRRLLDAHGIKVPSAEYEKKYTDKSKQAVYLSLGGELVSMFIVTYKGNSDIAEELRNLEQNGVAILVRTIDSNITQDRIAEDFGVFYRSVKILPTGLGNITKEMTDTPDKETRAYIATKGGIQSFARAISGCIKIKSNVTLSIFIQMVAIILGFVLVGTITFVSGIARLNILELLIYSVFWIAVVIIAPAIRKP